MTHKISVSLLKKNESLVDKELLTIPELKRSPPVLVGFLLLNSELSV